MGKMRIFLAFSDTWNLCHSCISGMHTKSLSDIHRVFLAFRCGCRRDRDNALKKAV